MNDEVTDINEILNVINTIQVISNKTTGSILCSFLNLITIAGGQTDPRA